MSGKTVIEKIQDSSITQKEVVFSFYMPVGTLTANSTTLKTFVKNKNRRMHITPYGTVEIRNRLLTEKHQKIVTAIIHNSEIKEIEGGRISATFSEIDILRAAAMGEKNYTALREQIKIIADAAYYITIEGYERRMSIIEGHILTDPSKKKMQGVIFSKEYVESHKSDFSVNFKKIFSQISSIPYPTIPTIIKYFMFAYHDEIDKNKVYSLMDVLTFINFPIETPGSVKECRKNLLLYKNELRDTYNILYDELTDTIICKDKIPGIEYQKPLLESFNKLEEYKGKHLKHNNTIYVIKDILQENTEKNIWKIITNKEDIELTYYLDDLLYFLQEATLNISDIDTPSLFDNTN